MKDFTEKDGRRKMVNAMTDARRLAKGLDQLPKPCRIPTI